MHSTTIKGVITALSPIHHGGSENYGTTRILLEIPRIYNGEPVNVPAIHGNTIRGYLRRLIMQDLLDTVEYNLTSKKLYHFLFTGGTLEAVDPKDVGTINLDMKREITETLPPVSLLGSALGNQMFPGKLKVGIADLVCEESLESQEGALSSFQLKHTDYGTRKDDLQDYNANEDERATQMIYEFQVVIPGSKFTHEFLLMDYNDVEYACFDQMMKLWEERPYLGGKSATGYGKVGLQYDMPESTVDYHEALLDKKEDITGLLDRLGERWK